MEDFYEESNKVIKKIFYRIVISLKLYKKEVMPYFSKEKLLEKCPYYNPKCVSEEYTMEMEDKEIFVSLIVPLYNSEEYIERLISMLLKQKTSYKYEVLFVNDGSKDGTEEVVIRYLEGYSDIIRYFKQENAGISAARNLGINHARGRYIGFIDHDDEIEEEYIQKLVKAAEEKNADTVFSYYTYKKNGAQVGKARVGGYIWGGIYKRKLFEQVRFPVGYWYEDMVKSLLLDIAAKNSVIIEEVLYSKAITKRNASKTLWNNSEYKCLHQLYLVYSLALDYQKLGYEKDLFLLKRVLAECSSLMVSRTSGIDKETRMQVFLACNKLIQEYDVENRVFTKNERDFYDAIINLDYSKWILLSK